MVKMVSLKKSAADRKAEQDAMGRPAEIGADEGGVHVHLDHHHLTKMGVGGALKSGDKVSFQGEGHVERSESRSEKGGDRHSATLRLHKGGVDHESGQEADKGDIRRDVQSSYDSAEKRRTEKAELAKGKSGKKVAE